MRSDLQSQMLYPVKGKDGRIIAVIEVDNSHNGMFAADEEFLLSILSESLSHSITMLGTEESFYLELHRHELVEQFQLALLRTKGEAEIAELVAEQLSPIFSANTTMIVFIHDGFLVKYRPKTKDQGVEAVKLRVDAGVCGEIATRRAPSLVIRAQCYPGYNGEVDISTTLPIYYVPLFKAEYDLMFYFT